MKNNLKWKIISLALFSSLIILALNFHCQIKVKNQEIENLKKEMEYSKEDKLKGQPEVVEQEENLLSGQWGAMAANDCLQWEQRQEMATKYIFEELIERHGMGNEENIKLIDTYSLQVDGSIGELYLARCWIKTMGSYCGIFMNYGEKRSEVIFQADESMDAKSLDEFYDMKIADVDGNGEEDIILLLGEHRSAGAVYYLPDIYCMVGLQEGGSFHFENNHTAEWIEKIAGSLFSEENDKRKIDNILKEMEDYFGKEGLKGIEEPEKGIKDYIERKENRILAKADSRSLYFEKELLWEAFYSNEGKDVQSIKVFRESGENGFSNKQIAVYVLDYWTEEIEKQKMPEVYVKLQKEYLESGGLKDVNLLELDYEDQDGDGTKDIRMLVECQMKPDGKIKKKYEVIFYQEVSPENPMKRFVRTSEKEIM